MYSSESINGPTVFLFSPLRLSITLDWEGSAIPTARILFSAATSFWLKALIAAISSGECGGRDLVSMTEIRNRIDEP